MTNTSRPMVRIHNAETNEIIDREMNDVEFEFFQAQQEENKTIQLAITKAEAEKAALLVRLGLTEDELKTILG